jgi:hypothetical protein
MSQSHKDDAREEANKHRFVDQSGLEASQLPDKGRPTGDNDTVTDVGRRNLPQQHGGGQPTAEGGARGDREVGDAAGHGGRKHN